MLIDLNGNIRASQICPKRGKPLAGKEPLNAQKENLHPLPHTELGEERPAAGLIAAETRKIKKNYLDHILSYELLKSTTTYRSEFLKRHNISPDIRARMVN